MKQILAEDYPIEIGSILESSFAKLIAEKYADSKVVIMVDDNTHDYCLEYLITNFEFLAEAEVMLIPAGEENKVLEVCFQVWQAMSEYNITRRDLVINLGGGVVTDMGGFIASVYKRGIDFINIPTSLLGMVDASVGGKTGIDLGPLKNQLGVFANPKAIFVDPSFLLTLDNREIVNGFAEMVKHALIQDPLLWLKFKEIEDLKDIIDDELIGKCIAIKNEVVLKDPKEAGIRKILNFGHTAGHALEGFYLDKSPIDHGHAVALGMICETYISWKMNFISADLFHEIEAFLLDWYPIVAIDNAEIPQIIELLHADKKNYGGKIQCCLLKGIGDCVYDQPVDPSLFMEAYLYLMNRNVNLN